MTKKEPKMEIDPRLVEEALKNEEPKNSEIEMKGETESPKPEDDTRDRLLRLAAEFDNYKKRMQKERSEFLRFAHENLVREVLPVLDNFERALQHARSSQDPEAIVKGVEMIDGQLRAVLDRFGVRSQSAQGQKFDPMLHEAVEHVASDQHPPQTVVQEHQKAYFLHDRLIRPALVSVAKEPEDSDPGSEKN